MYKSLKNALRSDNKLYIVHIQFRLFHLQWACFLSHPLPSKLPSPLWHCLCAFEGRYWILSILCNEILANKSPSWTKCALGIEFQRWALAAKMPVSPSPWDHHVNRNVFYTDVLFKNNCLTNYAPTKSDDDFSTLYDKFQLWFVLKTNLCVKEAYTFVNTLCGGSSICITFAIIQ